MESCKFCSYFLPHCPWKIACPMVEEIHSNGHAVGVYGIYKDHSAPPLKFSQRFMKRCAQGCSLQPHKSTEVGSGVEAPYWGIRQ